MKKLFSISATLLLFFAFTAGSINAQSKLGVVGKKFTKAEANVLFGKVIGSVQLSRKDLQTACANAKDYVLFKVKNSRAYLLNEKRTSLLADQKIELAPTETTYAFSTSVVEDFLASSTAETLSVEVRAEVLTVSDGLSTLEFSSVCPPYCP